MINFAVLFFLLYKFIKRPLVNAVRDRHQVLRSTWEEAKRAKELWEAKYKEYEDRLKRLDEEMERVRQEVLAEAERERERIIKEAEAAAERIRQQAKVAIEQELKMAERRLIEEVADMTVRLAEGMIKEKITPADHERMVDEYMEKIGRLS